MAQKACACIVCMYVHKSCSVVHGYSLKTARDAGVGLSYGMHTCRIGHCGPTLVHAGVLLVLTGVLLVLTGLSHCGPTLVRARDLLLHRGQKALWVEKSRHPKCLGPPHRKPSLDLLVPA